MPKPDKLDEIIDSLNLQKQPHTLDQCAQEILDFMSSVDPDWAKRIAILRDERNFSPKDVVTSLVAYPLDHSMHMEISPHPMLQRIGVGQKIADKLECVICGTEFKPQYGGHPPLCSNRCARNFYAKEKLLKEEAERSERQIPPDIEPTTVEQRMDGERQP